MKIFIILLISIFLYGESVVLKPIEVKSSSIKNSVFSKYSKEKIESVIVIQETAPGLKNPIIKGLQGDKILLTIDGMKFTNALFRDGPNQYYSWIPDEFIKEYELNANLTSITSNAIGGSLDRSIGVKSSKIKGTFNSSNNGYKEIAKYKNKSNQIAVLNNKTSNIHTPKGEIKHSSYNQKGAMIVHKGKIGETKSVFTQSKNIDRTDKFEKNQYYVYALQQYFLLKNKYYFNNNFISTLDFQQFKEKINRKSPYSKNVNSTDNMYGINLSGYKNLPNYDYISYGITNNFEDISYKKGITQNNYNYNILSLWSSYNGENKSFEYSFLYKYSYMNATGSGLNNKLYNNAFGIHTKENISFNEYVYINADMNYKFPSIDNLATATDGSTTNLPNKNLKQEKAYTLEVGYKNKWFKTSVFYKKLYDMIIKTETNILDSNGNNKWQYNNTDKGYIKGANVCINKKWNNYSFYVFGEYLNGKTDYGYISKLTPLHLYSKFGYKPFYMEWKYAPKVPKSKMAIKDKKDIRIKNHNYGYNIVNIGYKKTLYHKNIVKIEIKNLFNKTGRVYGSSVDFGERSLYVEYTYKL